MRSIRLTSDRSQDRPSLSRNQLKEGGDPRFQFLLQSCTLDCRTGDFLECTDCSGMSVPAFDADMGKVRTNDAPLSGLFWKTMSPPWASMIRLQMLRPRPYLPVFLD